MNSHLDWIKISALIPSPPHLLPSHILCLFSRTAPKGNFCLLPPLHIPSFKEWRVLLWLWRARHSPGNVQGFRDSLAALPSELIPCPGLPDKAPGTAAVCSGSALHGNHFPAISVAIWPGSCRSQRWEQGKFPLPPGIAKQLQE